MRIYAALSSALQLRFKEAPSLKGDLNTKVFNRDEHLVCLPSVATYQRNRKSPLEIDGFYHCHIKHSVALVKFFTWLEDHREKECKIDQKLRQFMAASDICAAVDTVAASGRNTGTMDHQVKCTAKDTAYCECNRVTRDSGLFMLRCGSHYETGTTAITRTMYFGSGKPTIDARRAYTSALKGLISVFQTRYPASEAHAASGLLDAEARRPFWANNTEYHHRTGHGVGNSLAADEAPMGIGQNCPDVIPASIPPKFHNFYKTYSDTSLTPGVVLTVAPGYFVPGKFGVCLENVGYISQVDQYGSLTDAADQLRNAERAYDFLESLRSMIGKGQVKANRSKKSSKALSDTEEEEMVASGETQSAEEAEMAAQDAKKALYQLRTLTIFPFCRKLVDCSMLTKDEKLWLMGYHEEAEETLSRYLVGPKFEAERQWLKNACEGFRGENL